MASIAALGAANVGSNPTIPKLTLKGNRIPVYSSKRNRPKPLDDKGFFKKYQESDLN